MRWQHKQRAITQSHSRQTTQCRRAPAVQACAACNTESTHTVCYVCAGCFTRFALQLQRRSRFGMCGCLVVSARSRSTRLRSRHDIWWASQCMHACVAAGMAKSVGSASLWIGSDQIRPVQLYRAKSLKQPYSVALPCWPVPLQTLRYGLHSARLGQQEAAYIHRHTCRCARHSSRRVSSAGKRGHSHIRGPVACKKGVGVSMTALVGMRASRSFVACYGG